MSGSDDLSRRDFFTGGSLSVQESRDNIGDILPGFNVGAAPSEIPDPSRRQFIGSIITIPAAIVATGLLSACETKLGIASEKEATITTPKHWFAGRWGDGGIKDNFALSGARGLDSIESLGSSVVSVVETGSSAVG